MAPDFVSRVNHYSFQDLRLTLRDSLSFGKFVLSKLQYSVSKGQNWARNPHMIFFTVTGLF